MALLRGQYSKLYEQIPEKQNWKQDFRARLRRKSESPLEEQKEAFIEGQERKETALDRGIQYLFKTEKKKPVAIEPISEAGPGYEGPGALNEADLPPELIISDDLAEPMEQIIPVPPQESPRGSKLNPLIA